MASPTQQTLGDNEGQGSRALRSPWGHRVGHDLVTRQQQQQQDRVLAYSFSPTICWGFNNILRKEWQEPLIGLSGHAVYSQGSVLAAVFAPSFMLLLEAQSL